MTPPNKMSAYTLFLAADREWKEELDRVFGRRQAQNVIHTKKSQGAPGTNLRLLAENREMARAQWERARFTPKAFGLASAS